MGRDTIEDCSRLCRGAAEEEKRDDREDRHRKERHARGDVSRVCGGTLHERQHGPEGRADGRALPDEMKKAQPAL